MSDQSYGEVAGLVEERSFWETPRPVTHDEAEAAASRFIAYRFKNDSEVPRVSIPANPERDDDLMLLSYIRQQRRAAAPTPSPVEARADGVRAGLSEERLRWIIRQAVVESGPIGGADSAAKEILASLESTPAQPVREGQEGKAEPVAWLIHDREDEYYGRGADTVRFCPLLPEEEDAGVTASPLYASQPDPAAEIAELRQEIADLRLSDAHICQQAADYLVRAERAESELAVIRERATVLVEALRWYAGDGSTYDGIDVGQRARAALANTAHRGQEEKGNG